MDVKSTTVDGLFLDDKHAAYDAAAKRFLSQKIILGWVLARTLKEFAACTAEEIAARYIIGTPEVSAVPIAPDKTNAAGRIIGENTEYKTLTEGTTVFDIRCSVKVPGTGEAMRIICNCKH